MQLPSASNSAGTLAGTVVGGIIAASVPTMPWAIAAAAAVGMTPLGFAGGLAVVATAAVNYAVTHWAEAANLNDKLKDWWPLLHPQQSFPQDPQPSANVSNINKS
jgi:hypothetical protein